MSTQAGQPATASVSVASGARRRPRLPVRVFPLRWFGLGARGSSSLAPRLFCGRQLLWARQASPAPVLNLLFRLTAPGVGSTKSDPSLGIELRGFQVGVLWTGEQIRRGPELTC